MHVCHVYRYAVFKIAIKVCLPQLRQHAHFEFKHRRRNAAAELADKVLRVATEEIAGIYHHRMLQTNAEVGG